MVTIPIVMSRNNFAALRSTNTDINNTVSGHILRLTRYIFIKCQELILCNYLLSNRYSSFKASGQHMCKSMFTVLSPYSHTRIHSLIIFRKYRVSKLFTSFMAHRCVRIAHFMYVSQVCTYSVMRLGSPVAVSNRNLKIETHTAGNVLEFPTR